jgi:glycosyltransferase involved in cell wall biosynthesis
LKRNILFLGKYPPIQGGTARNNYWLVQSLAKRGWEVSVVSNAYAGIAGERIRLETPDLSWLHGAPGTPRSAISLSLLHPLLSDIAYIPYADPFVSLIAAAALDIVRLKRPSIIYCSYLEPYGVAGLLVHLLTGIPYVFSHAGSDIYRLLRSPSLGPMHLAVLRRAARIYTSQHVIPYLRSLGVSGDQMSTAGGINIPWDLFADAAASARIKRNDERLQIGMYGKTGPSKGSIALIEAARLMNEDGLQCTVRLITNSEGARKLAHLRKADGAKHIEVSGYIPNWRIPEFIHTCDVCCFLEHDFWLPEHTPIVPLEILAAGTLVISAQAAEKLSPWVNLVHGENCLIVDDPSNPRCIARVLKLLFDDPFLASRIGNAGKVAVGPLVKNPAEGDLDADLEHLSQNSHAIDSVDAAIGRMRVRKNLNTASAKVVLHSQSGGPASLGASIHGVAEFSVPEFQRLSDDGYQILISAIVGPSAASARAIDKRAKMLFDNNMQFRLAVSLVNLLGLLRSLFENADWWPHQLEIRWDEREMPNKTMIAEALQLLESCPIRSIAISFSSFDRFARCGLEAVDELTRRVAPRLLELDLCEAEQESLPISSMRSALLNFLQCLGGWSGENSVRLVLRSNWAEELLAEMGVPRPWETVSELPTRLVLHRIL